MDIEYKSKNITQVGKLKPGTLFKLLNITNALYLVLQDNSIVPSSYVKCVNLIHSIVIDFDPDTEITPVSNAKLVIEE